MFLHGLLDAEHQGTTVQPAVGHFKTKGHRTWICVDSAMRISDFAKFTLINGFWLIFTLITRVGRDSSVRIATCYGMDGPGIESRWGARFSAPVQTFPGLYPASCPMGTASFPWLKRPGRGVDHPPHLAPRLKKEWSYTFTPPLGLPGLF
jgi:hypothetical protein